MLEKTYIIKILGNEILTADVNVLLAVPGTEKRGKCYTFSPRHPPPYLFHNV